MRISKSLMISHMLSKTIPWLGETAHAVVLCFFWARPPTQQSCGSHRIAKKSSSPSPICYFSSPFFSLSSNETKHSQVVFSFVDFGKNRY